MKTSRQTPRAIALGLVVANPLLHKPVSDMCDWVRARWGFALYDQVALFVFPLAAIGLAAGVLAAAGAVRMRREAAVGALLVAAAAFAAQRWLLVANIELIHFPQYAVMSGLLLAAGLSGPTAYLVSTAAGVVDEGYQHLVVYAGRPDTYFDVNDIVLNAIGSAWGAVLLADLFRRQGVASSDKPPRNRVESLAGLWRGAGVAGVCLAPALWLDPPHFVPLFRSITGGHALYRVLSAPEGIVMVTALWIVVVQCIAWAGNAGRERIVSAGDIAAV